MTSFPLFALLLEEREKLGSARNEGAETAKKGTEGLKELEEHHARLSARGPGVHSISHNDRAVLPEAEKMKDPALPTIPRHLRLSQPGTGFPAS
jgi:hypothetical protein